MLQMCMVHGILVLQKQAVRRFTNYAASTVNTDRVNQAVKVHKPSEYCAVGCTARLLNAFVREAPHLSTVRYWYAEFDRGRVSPHDEIREGRPSTAITGENVATVRRLIEENRRISYEEIRGHLGIDLAPHDFFIFPKTKDLMRGDDIYGTRRGRDRLQPARAKRALIAMVPKFSETV
ncbi:hypothetical protein EVAR_76058_1 [Eumeta japonica]|uniref:Mos1 transposase HTH domain-containing protein n=1 Tax=Eumeta variegata TaxID=151549 RepID=A0A4C1W432_EUMVA|nr:hypothetical protein EVAR_76058_1 [Eumeta japonica]